MIKTIAWQDKRVVMIDQRKLPREEIYVVCSDYRQVIEAIKAMVIRGAPAIGLAAALGAALGAQGIAARDPGEFQQRFEEICQEIGKARPTAINLAWALEGMLAKAEGAAGRGVNGIKNLLVREARRLVSQDVASNRALGRAGQEVIRDGDTILTHCNAGALATGGYGTALGVIRAARAAGKKVRVLADETRPFLQGTRLTAWELARDRIPVTLITDSMAGHFMKKGLVDRVIVGADRIAANGDTANKIGTYSVAVLARAHRIPFYVAAPCSTIDPRIKTGEAIPIEERDEKEVTHWAGQCLAPAGIQVLNPAFDVTPAPYITGIITERGLLQAPLGRSIREALRGKGEQLEAGRRKREAAAKSGKKTK
jgi:methylthioribose-1-phosphate isomerase